MVSPFVTSCMVCEPECVVIAAGGYDTMFALLIW